MGKWTDEVEQLSEEVSDVYTDYHETGEHPEAVIVCDEDGDSLLEIRED